MTHLDALVEFLDQFFSIHRGDDQGGVYRASARPVHRLGLALEPWPQLAAWVNAEHLDALFLHRPWKLQPEQLERDVGVLSYHLAFDQGMTLGCNCQVNRVVQSSDRRVARWGFLKATALYLYIGFLWGFGAPATYLKRFYQDER